MRINKSEKILEWAAEKKLLQRIPKDFNSSEKKYEDFIWHGIPENLNYFDDVIRLHLTHRNLTSLPDNFFETFSSLKELNLSGNELYYLPENMSISLEALNLDNNKETIRLSDMFDYFENLKSLEIHNTGKYGKAICCSKELKEKLISRNIGLTENDIEIHSKLESFSVNNITYNANAHILSFMIDSVDAIHENFLFPELKLSDLYNEKETLLCVFINCQENCNICILFL
jgi:hypothetical protein